MSTTPIGNSDYLRVWDNTGNNLNPDPSGSIIDNGFIADAKTDSSILNYAINILGQKVNQSLAYGSPQWSAVNEYRVGSTVNNSGKVYLSKVDSNLNNSPSSSPTQWDTMATQAWVSGIYAPLNSPSLTGVPTAPTAGAGTNTTQLATTAFVTTATHNIPRATQSVVGTTQLASSSDIAAGVDNTKAVTPANLAQFGGQGSLSQTGWKKIGSWIIQWGYVASTPVTQGFPIAFPNAVFSATVTPRADGKRSGNVSSLTTNSIGIVCGEGGSSTQNHPAYWIAIGH